MKNRKVQLELTLEQLQHLTSFVSVMKDNFDVKTQEKYNIPAINDLLNDKCIEEITKDEFPNKVQWTTVENLVLENSFGVVDKEAGVKMDCTIEIQDAKGGYFEVYDEETGGEEWYAEGRLEIENYVITGYDGVFELPEFLQTKLEEMGYDCSEL